jgi:hypothetical protein
MTMHIVTVAFFYPQLVIALKQAHDLNMSNRTIYAWYIAVIVDYVVIRVTLWAWSNYDQHLFFGGAGLCPGVHHGRRPRHHRDAHRARLPPRYPRAE